MKSAASNTQQQNFGAALTPSTLSTEGSEAGMIFHGGGEINQHNHLSIPTLFGKKQNFNKKEVLTQHPQNIDPQISASSDGAHLFPIFPAVVSGNNVDLSADKLLRQNNKQHDFFVEDNAIRYEV
mmetsp:Transcript_24882/g.32508  ORF Transcript_24882/g.32508 Transcript_24882/m.32508 type:complete len:125 (+) Transcript_24882:502-876(+)